MNKKAKDIIGCISFMVGLLILFAVLSVIFVPKDNSRAAGMEAVQANGILGEKKIQLINIYSWRQRDTQLFYADADMERLWLYRVCLRNKCTASL